MKKILALTISIICLGLSSCTNVKPWQRDVLSKKEMQFNSNKIRSAMDTHFYYSKEGSSGGSGFSGGGCGCN